ncbi:MAG: F0F1 ATP synthase subunit delta [Betaproteobacteria bacterium]|nr:F0F1 ATP synthase subunit delta [Betaproteobacteria bacterium]
MAEPVTVARPYAEAVFKLAAQHNALAAWSDALANIDGVVADQNVQRLISDPNISGQQLEGLVLGVVGDKVSGEARNFVQVLVSNNRLDLMPHIRAHFEALKREQEGVLEAKIISALPIDDAQVKQLVAQLETKYQRKVTAQVETDATLIGGVKIIVGDKVIDATVRGKLDAMTASLTS